MAKVTLLLVMMRARISWLCWMLDVLPGRVTLDSLELALLVSALRACEYQEGLPVSAVDGRMYIPDVKHPMCYV